MHWRQGLFSKRIGNICAIRVQRVANQKLSYSFEAPHSVEAKGHAYRFRAEPFLLTAQMYGGVITTRFLPGATIQVPDALGNPVSIRYENILNL
jgi:hypothetical protein